MTGGTRRNPVLASLSLLTAAALYGLPFLQVAPNRLVSGQPIYFVTVAPVADYLLHVLLLLLLVSTLACFFRPTRVWLYASLLTAALAIPGLVWLAASQASLSLQSESPIARALLGSALWVALVLLGLIVSSALQQLRASALQFALVGAALVWAVGLLLASGVCDDLSLMKEYANRADSFGQVIARHAQIVLLALACTLALGLPLGWAAHAQPKASGALLSVLNIIQTIPSIALFGLLMAPLALLAASLPVLSRAGISGVGLAPAVIALTLYGLLPVVRGTLAGLQQVPSAMVQAARALGLTHFQTLVYVELPLALPVLLGGVRTAAVSSVGLAAVTALIGAGGLGSVLFEGLFANAQDLVLLGVLPIIALGVVVNALFNLVIVLARRRVRPW